MKNYKIHCHVCDKIISVQADFLSVGQIDSNGLGYGTCNMNPNIPGHSRQEIRESFKSKFM